MELSNFTNQELEKLENLLQASTKVSNIIDYLCKLEINKQKDSKEYQNILLELTRAINIENEQYQSVKLTYQQCYRFSTLLASQTNMPIFDSTPSISIKHYTNRTIKRVINILTITMEQNNNFQQNIIPEKFIQELSNIGINITKDDFHKGIEHSVKIHSALNTDIYSVFLSLLENTISQKEHNQYQEQLIKAKYCFSTTNKELEVLLLESHFSIPNEIYISSKIINELLQETETAYNTIRFSDLKNKAQIEINKLLKIKDKEYTNQKTYIDTIISSCYLRAILSLMTDTELHKFETEFNNLINQATYLKEHINDRISENIILNCFKCYTYDKRKTRILSTKSK